MARLAGLVVMLAAVVVGCGNVSEEAPPAAAPADQPVADIAAAAPEKVSVVLDNEWARVMRITLEPGSELPRHVGGDRVVYSLSDYTIEWTEGDGPPTAASWTAGQAHWHTGGPHAVRNTGANVAEILVVERTGVELPAEGQVAGGSEAAPSPPEHSRVLLENEAVRVAEIALEPGQSTGRHGGGHRVVVSLSDYTLRWTEGEAEPVEVSWSQGQTHWHGPAEHEAENAGEGPARYLVVTFLS